MRSTTFATALALLGAGTQKAPRASLDADAVARISNLVCTYYAELDQDPNSRKSRLSLSRVVEAASRAAKSADLADPLLALDDWREIVRRGLMLEKPTVTIAARGEFRDLSIPGPLDASVDSKDLKDAFDGALKVLVSAPPDVAKVAYPVIVALAPSDPEVGKTAVNLKKSKQLLEQAKSWAAATYSKDVLAKAIVIVPILDCVRRSSDGITFYRPAWDSDEGVAWALKALGDVVLKNLNYDPARIFFDGAGAGAAAVLDYCTWFPGLQTGAIVRGPPPSGKDADGSSDFEARFEAIAGTPFLFEGGDAKALLEKFKDDAPFLTQRDKIDDATLLKWLNDHPKVFEPKHIKLRAKDMRFAQSHWIRCFHQNESVETEPIEIDAVVDREKNEITVVTNKKVVSFEIFFNDELLDLSRELRVLYRRADDKGEPKEFKAKIHRGIAEAVNASYKGTFLNTGDVYAASKVIEMQ